MKTLAPIGAEKCMTEIFIGEKENEQIKGLISKLWLLFLLLHNITHHYKALYQIPES